MVVAVPPDPLVVRSSEGDSLLGPADVAVDVVGATQFWVQAQEWSSRETAFHRSARKQAEKDWDALIDRLD